MPLTHSYRPFAYNRIIQSLSKCGAVASAAWQMDDALPHARNMVRLLPQDQQAQAFLAQIERTQVGRKLDLKCRLSKDTPNFFYCPC